MVSFFKYKSIIEKFSRFLPWVSFVWGVVSGVLTSRDFAHSTQLLLFFIGLLAVFMLLYFYTLWQAKIIAETRVEKKFKRILREKANLIEWCGQTIIQSAVQYLFMFSLTFQFYSHAWVLLGITLVAVITTLWDPWWQKLIRFEVYDSFIRGLAACIVMSFIISIFASYLLNYFQLVVGIFSFFMALPWKFFLLKKWKKCSIFSYIAFFPALSVLVLIGLSLCSWQVFPLLSIWVRHGDMGFNIKERQIAEPISRTISFKELTTKINNGDKLCCRSPIIAPSSLKIGVSHKWFIDSEEVDNIELGEAVGHDEKQSFRTYSCKKNVPLHFQDQKIICKVYLNKQVEIGEISANVIKDE